MKNQLWLMEPAALEKFLEEAKRVDEFYARADAATLQAFEAKQMEAGDSLYQVVDGVATIPIAGPIMKTVPWVYELLDIEATSSEDTTNAVYAALEDPDVSSIMLDIDSPGGSVAGLAALSDAVYEAREQKPVHAYAGDLAASAAYWIGSQASRFTAHRGASIGSIGVYTAVSDLSKLAEASGIKVHVISSGGVKGGIVDGAPVSDATLKDLQRGVDEVAEAFTADIARGRGMEVAAVSSLASGKTWLAATAKKHGLIDAVETQKTAFQSTARATVQAKKNNKEIQDMDQEEVKALVAASVADAMKGATAEIEAARAELEKMKARADASESKLAEAKEDQKAQIIKQAQADGRVTPTLLETAQKLAATHEPDELESLLSAWPKAINDKPEGKQEENKVDTEKQLSAEDKRIAAAFGLTPEEYALGNAAGVNFDGSVVTEVN